MKILLLEPHGDDALLSCYSLLKSDKHDIDVITFSDRGSENLGEYFSSVKYSKFYDLPNLWYPDGKPLLKTHVVHREFNEGLPIYENYVNLMRNDVFSDRYQDYEDEVYRIIQSQLLKEDYDLLVSPSGIVHPYHSVVKTAVDRLMLDDLPILYYVDKYYIQNRYAKEIYTNLLSKLGNPREINPGYIRYEEENTDISEKLSTIYPTEAKLLRFYSDIICWYPSKYFYIGNDNDVFNQLKEELTE